MADLTPSCTVLAMTLDREAITRQAIAHGVPSDVVEAAVSRIVDRSVILLGFSGKLASGKDSVAARIVDKLRLDPVMHYSFAQPLKDEVDQVLDLARRGSLHTFGEVMSVREGEPASQLRRLVELALLADPACDARTRTPEMRRVLQFWGTEIRRADDYDYWVKRATRAVFDQVSAGTHVYYTDGRFPNEILGSQSIGFRVFRLQVDPAVQAERLAHRDGLSIDADAQLHPSEIALDDFAEFDLVVDNNGPFERTVTSIMNWLQKN